MTFKKALSLGITLRMPKFNPLILGIVFYIVSMIGIVFHLLMELAS